jgi:tetratricopeptide (TPR) repeat protein
VPEEEAGVARRVIAGLALLASFGVLLYWAERAGYLPRSSRPESSGVHAALLRPASTLDLDSGRQGTPQADLRWTMAARDQPTLAAEHGALIAEGGATRWEDLDAARLAQLSYAPGMYSAWGPDAPVRKGAAFAVRTPEGNFARIRIAEVRDNYDLRIEWTLAAAPAAPTPPEPAPRPGPELAWPPLRDEALAAYRAQRYGEALEACRRGVEGASSGPRETLLKERCLRMLAALHRDGGRPRQAAELLALAVDTLRSLPPPETAEQRLALRADLHDLGSVLAQLGYGATARRALEEAREYYRKTEPEHPALKSIDAQLRRLAATGR